jgi:hypothetical protein
MDTTLEKKCYKYINQITNTVTLYYWIKDLQENKILNHSGYSKKAIDLYNIPSDAYIIGRWCGQLILIDDKITNANKKYFISKDYIDRRFLSQIPCQDISTTNNVRPNKIKLSSNKKFTLRKINLYGNKNIDNLYVSCSTISKIIGVKGLIKIISSNSQYIKCVHYDCFYIVSKLSNRNYFTYNGLLLLLKTIDSNQNKLQQLLYWLDNVILCNPITNTVTDTDTDTNIDTIINIDNNDNNKLLLNQYEIIKSVLSASSTPISCVYLLYLGQVRDLRKRFNISDNKFSDTDNVIKWGRTADLLSRLSQHYSNKFKSINYSLIKFTIIDNEYLSQAEADISNTLIDFGLKANILNKEEIAIASDKQIKSLKLIYDNIGFKYNLPYNAVKAKCVDLENHHKNATQILVLENSLQNEKTKLKMNKKTNKIALLKYKIKLLKVENNNSRTHIHTQNLNN